ncbi:hypothetical protein GCM10009864_21890 [Streptomyces lunalinharesii]|uniref:Secreted protein n=1 Tax=Streptomyces lunalinharesii TaxID=333384 RepID=A0ABN3RM88_9ACTN
MRRVWQQHARHLAAGVLCDGARSWNEYSSGRRALSSPEGGSCLQIPPKHDPFLTRGPHYAEVRDVTYKPTVPGSLHAAQTTHGQNLPSVEIHSKTVRLARTNK